LCPVLLVLLVAAALGKTASAAVVLSESFNYNPGGLNGQGGWTAAAGATIVDPTPDVTANGMNGGNRALQLVGNSADQAVHAFAAQTGDVFFSFLFRFDSGSLTDNDFLALWVDNLATGGGDHGTVPNIGLKVDQGAGADTLPDYFTRLQGGNEAYSTQAFLDEPVQIVGRLYKESSANYNRFALWINPDGSDFGSPDALATIGGSVSTVSRLGFRTATLSTGDVLLVDELRVGTSFEDVIVPEPSSLAIWGGIGLGALILARRRKSRTQN
jgi:hypothetical protein